MITTLLSYWVSTKIIRETLSSQTVPLTGRHIANNIGDQILRPLFISKEMANNAFLKNWITNGEKDQAKVINYLRSIKKRHKVESAFLISNISKNYYHNEGLLRPISPTKKSDNWYHELINSKDLYNVSISFDDRKNSLNVFIDYRVSGNQNKTIGITGVGIKLTNLIEIIKEYEVKYESKIYFIDSQGQVIDSNKKANSDSAITYSALEKKFQEKIAKNTESEGQLEYHANGNLHQVYYTYIPEVKWHLVIDKNESDIIAPLHRITVINLIISAFSTALVSVLLFPRLHKFQKHLEKAAQTDVLTKLSNRYHFDQQFSSYLKDIGLGTHFALILVDIDHFKKINDDFGHLAGDKVLTEIGQVLKKSIRQNDLVARWGGEEFIILLKDCPRENAKIIAEKLCKTASEYNFKIDRQVTVSCGMASSLGNEQEDEVLSRADRALYNAKEKGRNRVEIG